MNKSDYVLAFLLSLIISLWGLFSYHLVIVLIVVLIPFSGWRFTVLSFVMLIILILAAMQ